MDCFEFTDEEKEYIDQTLNIVLDDIHEIIKLIPLSNIYIESYHFSLKILENCIYISGGRSVGNIVLEEIKTKERVMWYKENKKAVKRKSFKDYPSKDQNCILRFLADYETYRNSLIGELKRTTENKSQLLSKLQIINSKYSNNVYIDFGSIETQNVKPLEVKEENGRTIGTIEFGNKVVKIVTDGDIVLNKIEKVKAKVKQKED